MVEDAMKILMAAEMKAADERTASGFGVSLSALMENAGAAVARFVLAEFAGAERITVICGKGNNGGDGFVAARLLSAAGKQVSVVLLAHPEDLRGDAQAEFERCRLPVIVAADETQLGSKETLEAFSGADLFVDAVFGTGFKPPVKGIAETVRELLLHQAETPVLAVDVPSGWDADSQEMSAEGAFPADAVVTFTAAKMAHVFGNLVRRFPGKGVVVAPIGSPEAAVVSATGLSWTGASKRVTERPRKPNSNKGMYGHVLLIGGSRGKAGAPAMSSLAALRAGAGLVTAAVPESLWQTVGQVTPELMMHPLCETARGGVALKNLEQGFFDRMVEKIAVIAIGPGLGQEPETVEFVRGLPGEMRRYEKMALVLDADALNAFAGHAELLDGRGRTVVLTPHPGEMARLAGMTIREVEADRIGLARRFAVEHQVTLVLKGWRTLVAHPDGEIAVNTTGNPGMAKGGSGDILTGIVAALVGQHPDNPKDAVNAAVYLHGLAADFAVRSQDEHTLLATDTVAELHRAFRFGATGKAGYTWLQGIPRGE